MIEPGRAWPFVTIVVLNYNGEQFLDACLGALRTQTYPADCFEVVLVDNASTDGSIDLVRTSFPWVRLIRNDKNLGFSGGNNVALSGLTTAFAVLLNNDTEAQPSWLAELVSAALRDPQVGIVTSRLQMFYDELSIAIDIRYKAESQSSAPIAGVNLLVAESEAPYGIVQYYDGVDAWQTKPDGRKFRPLGRRAVLGVSVPRTTSDWNALLVIENTGDKGCCASVESLLSQKQLCSIELAAGETRRIFVNIPKTLANSARTLLQNAGSIMFENGMGRDRGTYVKNHEAFYSIDTGDSDPAGRLFAGCGGAMLMRLSMLSEIGLLDESFFMYYEDIDLSWRARMRGWQISFAANAMVRHIHCASSKEWSPLFVFNIERNRLAMLIKNAGWRVVFRELLFFVSGRLADLLVVISTAIRPDAYGLKRSYALARLNAAISILAWLPAGIGARRKIQESRTVSESEISTWITQQ